MNTHETKKVELSVSALIRDRLTKRLKKVIEWSEEKICVSRDTLMVLDINKQGQQTPPDLLEGLPPPITVGQGLDTIRNRLEKFVEDVTTDIERCANAVMDPKTQDQALRRHAITDFWPWPRKGDPGAVLVLLLVYAEIISEAKPVPDWHPSRFWWPGQAAPFEVAKWAEKGLNKVMHLEEEKTARLGELIVDQVSKGRRFKDHETTLENGSTWHIPSAGLALLYLAEKEVKDGLKRKAIAVDAGKISHGLIRGWNTESGKRRRTGGKGKGRFYGGRIELFDPRDKNFIQLSIPSESGVLQEEVIKALRRVMSPEGFRHWTGFLLMLSDQGARRGWVRWTMKEHLEALGYKHTVRENPERLNEIAKIIELFTKLELVVYDENGQTRDRRPLIIVSERSEKLEESRWRLDGLKLHINPLLYNGVRNNKTGELGTNWFPASAELAQVDHVRHPICQPLGLLMTMNWRWDLLKDKTGRDHLARKGAKLLELANLTPSKKNPSRAWDQLERDLEKLREIGQLDRWEWDGKPRTLDAVCRLYPPDWILDRTVRGLTPEEKSPQDLPKTGAELKKWREDKGWSQSEAARKLDVHRNTISNAEKNLSKRLSNRLTEALVKTF